MARYYPRFVAASGMTNLADGIATVAWAWLASLLTRDAFLIALVPVALRLPWVLLALPAGIWTDRLDRKKLIIAMDVLRTVSFGLAAVSIFLSLPLSPPQESGLVQPVLFWLICLAAFVVGVAEVFRDNAAQTMMPALVPHDQLERANGRLWSVEMVGNALLGPAVGAFLIAASVPLPFALNAIAFVCAIFLVASISGNFKPEQRADPDWRTELREAAGFLNSQPLLRTLALVTGFWNLLFTMVAIALVLHVQENLGLSAQAYGLILAGGAVGGVLAGFTAERVVAWLGQGASARWMLAACIPSFLGMVFAPNGFTLALTLASFEFTGVVWNTVSVSYRQRIIPDQMLGRVNSIYRLLAWGMMPVGLLLSGLLVKLGEGVLPRSEALALPFYAAVLGGILLTAFGWRALQRGFDQVR